MSAIKSHSPPMPSAQLKLMPIVTSARDLLEQHLLGTRAIRCFRGGEFNGLALYKILEDGPSCSPVLWKKYCLQLNGASVCCELVMRPW